MARGVLYSCVLLCTCVQVGKPLITIQCYFVTFLRELDSNIFGERYSRERGNIRRNPTGLSNSQKKVQR